MSQEHIFNRLNVKLAEIDRKFYYGFAENCKQQMDHSFYYRFLDQFPFAPFFVFVIIQHILDNNPP